MKIVVDDLLLRFIQEHHCPELPLDRSDKEYFTRIIDFSSIDETHNPINDTFLAIDCYGNGHPFTCSREQIKQSLEIIIEQL